MRGFLSSLHGVLRSTVLAAATTGWRGISIPKTDLENKFSSTGGTKSACADSNPTGVDFKPTQVGFVCFVDEI